MDTSGLRDALLTIAQNHRWTWSIASQNAFEALPTFDADTHPVQVVAALDESQLEDLLGQGDFTSAVSREAESTTALEGEIPDAPSIAYFSPEFGISDLVPQYSGGLGVLAGDHLKAASDLGESLCAVGLFYRGGFFRQDLVKGRQAERYETYEPADLGYEDTGITVTIPFPKRDVEARVWRLNVGRVALLVLDTDVESNRPADRAITDRLYSGDRRHRIEQELVLGVGGARALQAIGWDAPVKHLNEGHAGFLILELLDREIAAGVSLQVAIETIRPRLVFTTHTPVPAGIDRFEPKLATEYLASWAKRWGVAVSELLSLGTDPSDDPPAFNMAAFCLRAASRANGVSKLHGEVSRELFAAVPGGEDIGSVTNGVHARTWVMPRLQGAFDEVLGEGWADGDTAAWSRVDLLEDERIRSLRRAGAEDLAAVVADRTDNVIDPDALIVGFARRFATYKRANLLLAHPEELGALLSDDERPIQFVFTGKAHPADKPGKALIAEVVKFAHSKKSHGRFIFVPDYDMGVARAMYAGCDVWLNNPIRPHEASGTSGEKSALNGGLNCSIRDGWWDEMADDRNGWSIPNSDAVDPAERDRAEGAAALALLRDEIVAEYHADGAPWSAAWLERMRDNWRSLGPKVTAGRMLLDYRERLYGPAVAEVTGAGSGSSR